MGISSSRGRPELLLLVIAPWSRTDIGICLVPDPRIPRFIGVHSSCASATATATVGRRCTASTGIAACFLVVALSGSVAAALAEEVDLVFDPFKGVAGAGGGQVAEAAAIAAAAAGSHEGEVGAPGGCGEAGAAGTDLGEEDPGGGGEEEQEEEEEEEEAPAAHFEGGGRGVEVRWIGC
jgi:hypothetical protein